MPQDEPLEERLRRIEEEDRAILYFILNGDTMFLEDSDEVRLKKRDWNFVKRRIDETLKHVNAKFKRILYKTLHPDPKERYQSCDEFLKSLS